MRTLTIPLDNDFYEVLEVQKKTVELITEVERSMEDFVSMLVGIGSTSLGRAMTPQSEVEMNEIILSLIGEAPAEEIPFMKRLHALMRKQQSIRFGQEIDR
jgi:hypothetical protein